MGNGTNLAIFQSVVVIVGVCLNPPSGGPVVEVIKAPENFSLVFGYSHDQLPMLLEELLSVANIANEKDEEDIMGAIQSGHRHKATIVLRHAQGADLACNVEVSKGNLMKEGYKSPSSVDPDGLHRDFLTTVTIQLCCNSANVRALGINPDPSLMDPKQRSFDEIKRNQIVAEAERRIDENTQKNKEQKELKEKKPSKNHTIRGAMPAASTEPHPASAPVSRNNNTSSSSSSTRLSARSTERPVPPAVPSQPTRAEISTAETIEASMTEGYYVPVPRTIAVAVPIGAEEYARRGADLPVVELEPLEEEISEGDEGVDSINSYDMAIEQRESEAESVENVSSIDGSENDGHRETISETEDAPVPYQNIC